MQLKCEQIKNKNYCEIEISAQMLCAAIQSVH